MIGDPGPILGFAEDRAHVPEAELPEDPQLEHLPIGLVQSVQGHVDAEAGVPVRHPLLHALVRVRQFLRDGFVPALPPGLVQIVIPGDGAQPGGFVRFAAEGALPGKRLENARKKVSWVISSAWARSPAKVMA